MIIGILLLAVPFAFGLVRLWTTGDDLRYLVVAAASSVGALAMLMPRRMTRPPAIPRALVATLVATVCAAIAAFAVGSRNPTSVAVVSVGFALCSGAGAFLCARGR